MPDSSRDTLASRFAHINTLAALVSPHVAGTTYFPTDGQGNMSTVAAESCLQNISKLVLRSIRYISITSTTTWEIRNAAGTVVLLTGVLTSGTGTRVGLPDIDIEIDQGISFQIVSGNADMLFEYAVIR